MEIRWKRSYKNLVLYISSPFITVIKNVNNTCRHQSRCTTFSLSFKNSWFLKSPSAGWTSTNKDLSTSDASNVMCSKRNVSNKKQARCSGPAGANDNSVTSFGFYRWRGRVGRGKRCSTFLQRNCNICSVKSLSYMLATSSFEYY